MAIKRKKNKNAGTAQASVFTQMKERFLKRAAELWETHEEEIILTVEQSDKHKASVTFSAEINLSESSPQLTTHIRAGQPMTDKTEDTFDDPNQLYMPGVVDHDKEERSKKVRKFATAAGIEEGDQGNGTGAGPEEAA